MGHAGSVRWSLLDVCNALCLFCSLQEGGGSHGSPLSMNLARYHHLAKCSSMTSFIAWLWRCMWTFFWEQKRFFNSWVLFAFENLYLSVLVTFFQHCSCVVVLIRKPFGKWRDYPNGGTSAACAHALMQLILMASTTPCRPCAEKKS